MLTINAITPDDLIDSETSIHNTMTIVHQAEQILEVLIYMGEISENSMNNMQLKEVANLLYDAQHELMKGLIGTEPECMDVSSSIQ